MCVSVCVEEKRRRGTKSRREGCAKETGWNWGLAADDDGEMWDMAMRGGEGGLINPAVPCLPGAGCGEKGVISWAAAGHGPMAWGGT